MTQKILIVDTPDASMRSEIQGWGGEDSNKFIPNKPIGFSGGFEHPLYKTVLEAMYYGWKLMAPPTKNVFVTNENKEIITYEWWLTKD